MFERPIQVGFENVFLVLAFAVFSNLYMLKTNCDDNYNIMILFPEWSVRGQHLERCSFDETSRACPASTTQRLRPEVKK